jgi:putative transposase
MLFSTLRTVGGSVMFAIPEPILDGLGLSANTQVGLSISRSWVNRNGILTRNQDRECPCGEKFGKKLGYVSGQWSVVKTPGRARFPRSGEAEGTATEVVPILGLGTTTLAGQKMPTARPRVRRTDGGAEVPLETYARMLSSEAMPEAILRRMVRGVSTRDYASVIDLTRDGYGVKKSSISRDFVRASAAQVKALAERRFDGMHFPVILIDGVDYAGETMIVTAGITADGTKRVLGLRQGATENAAVCVALLEDLQARGLDTGRPVLLVLDGAKALHAAAKRVWGQDGVIQRRQVHKNRNGKAHVPEKHHVELERRLSEAYHETGYEAARASLEATVRWLERINADAASSLREGLEETLTVVRLGVPGALRRTLATTNRSSRR